MSTSMEIAKEIMKKLQDNGSLELLVDTYCRWLDERQYEDFADYEKAIKKNLDANILKVTKRPFCVIIGIDKQTELHIVLSGKSRVTLKANIIKVGKR